MNTKEKAWVSGKVAVVLATLVSLSHAQPSPSLQRFEFRKVLMGVECRIVLYARDVATAKRACTAAFDRIAQLDAIMSDYRPDSELMQLCAKAHEAPVKVSEDLFVVLKTALEIAKASGGAFDITVGPFVALWRRARQTKQLPTEAELVAAKEKVGWQKVQLDLKERTVRLLVAGMRLDLGGIAKGYAGDCALAVLRRFGITQAMVEFGGDIVLGDPPPKRKGWRIALPDAMGKPQKVLELKKCAVSTSGATEQFVEINGQRYAHIVDPRTGLGLTKQVLVTVIAKKGILSDPLATALCVLGEKEGQKLATAYGVTAYFARNE